MSKQYFCLHALFPPEICRLHLNFNLFETEKQRAEKTRRGRANPQFHVIED